MAEFKKAIEKTLKPLARKVGSDIRNIEAKVFAGKVINVLDFGIDNTGATDVTEKLNELFRKVRDENYTEVIFPDGTYKISGKVSVFIPGDRHKYLYIHAQNRYKTILKFHGNREGNYTGLELKPESFSQTRGYNVKIDGFTVNNMELPAEGSQIASQSIFGVFFTQDTDEGFNAYDYKFYNFECTNMQYNNGYYAIYMTCGLFDSEIKNISIENMEYSIDMSGQYSNNNKIENILFKNCKNNASISIKASIKNIDVLYDNEEIAREVGNAVNLTCYNLSNLSYKGYYDLSNQNNLLTINCTAGATVSDIRLDLKPFNIERANNLDVPTFISLSAVDSEVSLLNISNVTFDSFDANFTEALSKVDYFAFFDTLIPLSIHGITETANLKFFKEKGVNLVYDKSGYMLEAHNTKNTHFISRPYIGADRNMNGIEQAAGGKLGAIYIASSEGTPLQGKGTDYSENTAAVKGDIFTEVDPNKYGHFAYVSTYEHATSSNMSKEKVSSVTYNEADKTYTITFTDLPTWSNGTLMGKVPNVGSVVKDSYLGIDFEIKEVNEDAKTFTVSANPESKQGIHSPYKFDPDTDPSNSIFMHTLSIEPRKVNRMKNMTFATVPIIHSGTTENRPTEHLVIGQTYFDTTLGAPVFWTGSEWVKANTGEIDTSSLATKEEIKAIPAANITQDDNHYFVTKYQQAKLGNLYNRGEFDTLFTKKADLANYTTTAALTTKLGDYATTTSVDTKLADYTTTAALTTKLADYATTAAVESKVANVVKEDALTTKLADYATTAAVESKVANVVKTDALTTKLADYPTKTEMQAAIAAIPAPSVDTSNLVTKEELNATLNAINEKLKQIRGE